MSKNKDYKIISGFSQQYYHTIPEDLDLITTTPTREGIFKYLSQIGHESFPEFVLDVLCKVDGHTAIDVTDGPGDEKQDILTINADGERCLVQCKHTINYKSNYNGDDLDLLVVACMRKNCKHSIFITNSDLTPQGKRYVTDQEYKRGFNNLDDCPVVEYWNGIKIWEKVKNNQDIINKWFGGLGQVHGLRNFKFDITLQTFPQKESGVVVEEIFKILSGKSWIKEVIENVEYEAHISSRYKVLLKKWIQFPGRLDINFSYPDNDIGFINKPMYALSVEVVMNNDAGKYTPNLIRAEIVKKIAEILNPIKTNGWWHITSSQIRTFIYLHDISEPREVTLASALTFLKVNGSQPEEEFSYCLLPSADFSAIDEDDSVWMHKKSTIKVVQNFEQRVNPVQHYDYQIRQINNLKEIATYNFFAVENIDSSFLMRVRKVLDLDWIGLQHNQNNLIWAVPPDYDESRIKFTHNKISAMGLKVLKVRPSDIQEIIDNVQRDLPPVTWMYISEMKDVSFPILLNKRLFWLFKEIPVVKKIDVNFCIELLTYKYGYEVQFGFDNLLGKTEQQINTLELKDNLFDCFTIRGSRMLDIGIMSNTISINVRFLEGKVGPSREIVNEYLEEFEKVYKEIETLIEENASKNGQGS